MSSCDVLQQKLGSTPHNLSEGSSNIYCMYFWKELLKPNVFLTGGKTEERIESKT